MHVRNPFWARAAFAAYVLLSTLFCASAVWCVHRGLGSMKWDDLIALWVAGFSAAICGREVFR